MRLLIINVYMLKVELLYIKQHNI